MPALPIQYALCHNQYGIAQLLMTSEVAELLASKGSLKYRMGNILWGAHTNLDLKEESILRRWGVGVGNWVTPREADNLLCHAAKVGESKLVSFLLEREKPDEDTGNLALRLAMDEKNYGVAILG